MEQDATAPRERCIATAKSGEPCKTSNHAQSKYCFFHDPEIPEDVRQEHRSQGGLATRGVPRGRGKTAEELAEILGKQLDQFLLQTGGTVTGDSIKAVCELVKCSVAVMAHLKVDQGEMGLRLRKTG